MRRASRFRFADAPRCPVCSFPLSPLVECCSTECSEELEDARDNIGWLRVRNADRCAELFELEEKLGPIQLKLEGEERRLERLSSEWTRVVTEGRFARANQLRQVAVRSRRTAKRLSKLLDPLDRKWKVLKEETIHSERELKRMESILREVC